MNRVFFGFNLISALLIVVMWIFLFGYMKDRNNYIANLKLHYATNNSIDAATAAMLETEDLDMDYDTDKEFKVNPQTALNEFVDVTLMNYGIRPNQQAREDFKLNNLPLFCVVDYDGYYIGMPGKAGVFDYETTLETPFNYTWFIADENPINKVLQSGSNLNIFLSDKNQKLEYSYDIVFTPKLPFTYIDEQPGKNKRVFALNMGSKKCNYIEDVNGDMQYKKDIVSLPTDVIKNEVTIGGVVQQVNVLTEQERRFIEINKQVSNGIYSYMNYINEKDRNWNKKFTIPIGISEIQRSNSIAGPSCIAAVQNIRYDSYSATDSFTIGGAKIDKNKVIIGYKDKIGTQPETKYYCYVENAPANVEILEVFTSPEKAAAAGYYCDYRYM